MAKESLINEIFKKIGSIFKKDAYIIDYQYCIGGPESEEKLISHIALYFDSKSVNTIKEALGDNSTIYIKDIKEIRVDIDNNTEKVTELEKKDLYERLYKITNFIKDDISWEPFNLSEEELYHIFKTGSSLNIFGEDSGIPEITIGRNMFPTITDKKFNKMIYNVMLGETEDSLNHLVTRYVSDYFEIYNVIQFISI